jgi:hypothetical protein
MNAQIVDSLVQLDSKEGMTVARRTLSRGRLCGRSGAVGHHEDLADQFGNLLGEWRDEAESEFEDWTSHSRMRFGATMRMRWILVPW